MKKVSGKIILWLISLTILLSAPQKAFADKYSIDRFDRYLDNEVNFYDSEGNKVFLDQFEGTTILLVFWATWCGTCVSELPSLDNLQKDFRKLPFKIISVSQDFKGIEVAKKHFSAHGIRHLETFHDRKNKLFRELSVIGLPTAFLINAEGKNKIVFRGRIKWHDDRIRSIILSEIGEDLELPKNTYKFASLNRNVMLNEVPAAAPSEKPNEAEEQKSKVK
jgi:thiol-disulfide isomerase/thioredoxin